jgi:hypothetical protein
MNDGQVAYRFDNDIDAVLIDPGGWRLARGSEVPAGVRKGVMEE